MLCHRCGGDVSEPREGWFVAVTEVPLKHDRQFWERFVCRACVSFICAAIDGRPLFSAGNRAQYVTGPDPSQVPPPHWGNEN